MSNARRGEPEGGRAQAEGGGGGENVGRTGKRENGQRGLLGSAELGDPGRARNAVLSMGEARREAPAAGHLLGQRLRTARHCTSNTNAGGRRELNASVRNTSYPLRARLGAGGGLRTSGWSLSISSSPSPLSPPTARLPARKQGPYPRRPGSPALDPSDEPPAGLRGP